MAKIGALIVPYEARHRASVCALFGEDQFKPKMWDWQYFRLEQMTPHPALVLEAKGQVVGFNGVMPVTVSINGTRLDAMWSCDFYIAPEYRFKGFGVAMKSQLKQRADLIMVRGISDRAALVLEKSGWKPINCVFVARRFSHVHLKRAALLILQFWNRLRRFPWRFIGGGMSVLFGAEIPAAGELDALWEHVANGYPCAVVRDSTYLLWRYATNAPKSYRFVVARDRDGVLQGLAVVRKSEESLLLVDMVAGARDARVRSALVGQSLKCYRDCDSYTCTTSDPLLLRALEAYGFYVSRDRPRFYVWGHEHLTDRPYQLWYVMGGDSDDEMRMAAKDAWGESA